MFRLIEYFFFSEKQKETKSENHWGIGLPKAVMSEVLFGYHTVDEAKNFAAVSEDAKAAYKDLLGQAGFVEYVAKGEQELAEKMLCEANPGLRSKLLSQKVSIKDFSGRTFFNITTLQYAVWALDRHMWTMLQKYMSNDEIRKQLEEMEREGGVEYELPAKSGETKKEIRREKHYDFNELIDALQNIINLTFIDYGGGMRLAQRQVDGEKLIVSYKLLGYAQRNVPAHVASEYCHSTRSFATFPDFSEDKNLTRSFTTRGLFAEDKSCWFPLVKVNDCVLGEDFVIFRGNDKMAYRAPIKSGVFFWHDQKILMDVEALRHLFNTRLIELEKLNNSVLMKENEEMLSSISLKSFY